LLFVAGLGKCKAQVTFGYCRCNTKMLSARGRPAR
jgi:hypothetical protein